MTKWTIPDGLAKRLRNINLTHVDAMTPVLDAADRIEALEAENARLRAAHLTIIQSAPTLQYAIQTSRDALYPKEGGE